MSATQDVEDRRAAVAAATFLLQALVGRDGPCTLVFTHCGDGRVERAALDIAQSILPFPVGRVLLMEMDARDGAAAAYRMRDVAGDGGVTLCTSFAELEDALLERRAPPTRGACVSIRPQMVVRQTAEEDARAILAALGHGRAGELTSLGVMRELCAVREHRQKAAEGRFWALWLHRLGLPAAQVWGDGRACRVLASDLQGALDSGDWGAVREAFWEAAGRSCVATSTGSSSCGVR